jgi:hypothetical protein
MSGTPTRVNPFAAPATLTFDVSDIAPSKPRLVPTPDTEQAPPEQQRLQEKAELRQVAQEAGFNIDNYEEKPIKAAKKPPAPTTFLKTFRLRVSDYNQFQRWCDRNNYSQQQGFNILVANLPKGKG